MCGAKYVAEQKGVTCAVCALGRVGEDATGLVVSPSQR